jgi:hypothetical protein
MKPRIVPHTFPMILGLTCPPDAAAASPETEPFLILEEALILFALGDRFEITQILAVRMSV